MRNIFFFLFQALCFSLIAQQAPVAAQYASTIESKSLKEHVYVLASPEFEGRETGSEGIQKAAQYIADQFSSYGIEPIPGDGDFFQELAFTRIKWENIRMTVNGEPVEHIKDYLSVPQFFPTSIDSFHIESLTFLGYGIDDPAYSDYKGKNVVGQHLIVFSGEPKDKNGNYRVSGDTSPSSWSIDPVVKAERARIAGAASIWIIENNLKHLVAEAKKTVLTGGMIMGTPEQISASGIPHAFISADLSEKILGKKKSKVNKLLKKIEKTGKTAHLNIPADIEWNILHQITSTPGVNVLGYIEGTDPTLKDELVIVTAHYDHLGKRGSDIYYGADDNASGTGAILEIAQAMSQAKSKGDGPRRSVLCMLLTGEEKGLLGSQYYTEFPVFPLENTVADVNIDMIGRMDTRHTSPNYTYVIGSDRLSTELHAINEQVNSQYTHLELDYTYNADDDPNRFYYRSDHYNFAKHGIPAIFFFSGVHEDYHRPTDTADKVMYDKAETIAQLAFHTAWELANRDERIKVDVSGRN